MKTSQTKNFEKACTEQDFYARSNSTQASKIKRLNDTIKNKKEELKEEYKQLNEQIQERIELLEERDQKLHAMYIRELNISLALSERIGTLEDIEKVINKIWPDNVSCNK